MSIVKTNSTEEYLIFKNQIGFRCEEERERAPNLEELQTENCQGSEGRRSSFKVNLPLNSNISKNGKGKNQSSKNCFQLTGSFRLQEGIVRIRSRGHIRSKDRNTRPGVASSSTTFKTLKQIHWFTQDEKQIVRFAYIIQVTK